MTLEDTRLAELETQGLVRLPELLPAQTLQAMQTAFAEALRHPRFNTWPGFEQNERWRRLVENCLCLHAGFVELALHPVVLELIEAYLGQGFVLTEARGWETIATRRNFHGWHIDAWHAPDLDPQPRQLKLGFYLSDVHSGQFRYLAGSHRPAPSPGHWNDRQVAASGQAIVDILGPAGSAFLFDTAGIHRQSSPVLYARRAVFFNYHDPSTPLLASETRYGRYAPPLLNPAMLPQLNPRQQAILGMGRPQALAATPVARRFPRLHELVAMLLQGRLLWQDFSGQVGRLLGAAARLWRR